MCITNTCEPSFYKSVSNCTRKHITAHSSGYEDINGMGSYITVDGAFSSGVTRSWSVSVFDSSWNFIDFKNFDVYANEFGECATSGISCASAMNNYLSTISPDKYVIFVTQDEPLNNRDVILNNLLNFGASQTAMNSMQTRSSYIMVGRKGLGSGNAYYESYGPYRGTGTSLDFSVNLNNISSRMGWN